MSIAERLLKKREKLAVIGLGYVGLPAALSFSRKFDVIGFDTDCCKIDMLKNGQDPVGEAGVDTIKESGILFTDKEHVLKEAAFLIIAVPTPVMPDHTPDLTYVREASRIVGRNLRQDAIIVYESTVYPGVTQDICIPILEEASGKKCGTDFGVGFSPERINPGDSEHRFENVKKIVSGSTPEICSEIAQVYGLVVKAGIWQAPDIRTAEAVKIAENIQRDVNIALMNELAVVFGRMGIDTGNVIDGMNTKWNALGFRPGLVGGHCIGVDPYYFTYEAEKLGYHDGIIMRSRLMNDRMGSYIADEAIRKMKEAGMRPEESKVAVLGFTFKENCHDIRNTKAADVIRKLQEYGVDPVVADPWADPEDTEKLYGISLIQLSEITDANCVIIVVAHESFRELGVNGIEKLFAGEPGTAKILLDVKGILPLAELKKSGMIWWRL